MQANHLTDLRHQFTRTRSTMHSAYVIGDLGRDNVRCLSWAHWKACSI